MVILSSALGRMMGGKQLAQCYSYFFVAGCWTRLIVGPSFATMSAAAQRAEGGLLAGHARLLEYAEEVTMLGGGAAEGAQLDASLRAVQGSALPGSAIPCRKTIRGMAPQRRVSARDSRANFPVSRFHVLRGPSYYPPFARQLPDITFPCPKGALHIIRPYVLKAVVPR